MNVVLLWSALVVRGDEIRLTIRIIIDKFLLLLARERLKNAARSKNYATTNQLHC